MKNANKYIELGNYFWNTGMFMFKASKYLNELKEFGVIFNEKEEKG